MTSTVELPDFEDIFKLVEEIGKLNKAKSVLELEISFTEADTAMTVMNNPEFYLDGKKPSMEYVKNTYLITGLNNELLGKRRELVELETSLNTKRLKLDMYKYLIEIWRTQSANERNAIV